MQPSLNAASELHSLLQKFGSHQTDFREQYGRHLLDSWEALNRGLSLHASHKRQHDGAWDESKLSSSLAKYRDKCQKLVDTVYERFCNILLPASGINTGRVMHTADLWPRITTRVLLHLLAKNGSVDVPSNWKTAIAMYGQAITFLQQAERLLDHVHNQDFA